MRRWSINDNEDANQQSSFYPSHPQYYISLPNEAPEAYNLKKGFT